MRERTEKVTVTVLKTASTYSRKGDNLRPPSGDKYKVKMEKCSCFLVVGSFTVRVHPCG